MSVQNVSRDTWIISGLALLLAISLLVFPWYHISLGPFSADAAATSSPYAIWGILALIGAIALLAYLAVEQASPQTQLPTIGGTREMTLLAIAGVTALFLVIKFFAHIGDFGWGFFLIIVIALALGYFLLQTRAGRPVIPAGTAGPPSS